MDREMFLSKLVDALQTEEDLSEETILEDIEEWDSLSKMAVMALLDKELGIKITMDDIKGFVKIEDIMKKAGL